jgi:ABC-type molybdate transport system substrate-binding protein
MEAKSGNRRAATALVLWVATLILTGTAFGQTAERYVTLEFNKAAAHVFDAVSTTEAMTAIELRDYNDFEKQRMTFSFPAMKNLKRSRNVE